MGESSNVKFVHFRGLGWHILLAPSYREQEQRNRCGSAPAAIYTDYRRPAHGFLLFTASGAAQTWPGDFDRRRPAKIRCLVSAISRLIELGIEVFSYPPACLIIQP